MRKQSTGDIANEELTDPKKWQDHECKVEHPNTRIVFLASLEVRAWTGLKFFALLKGFRFVDPK